MKHLAARERPRRCSRSSRCAERATGLGYVSGHSAVAFALATVLAPELPARGASCRSRSRPAWAFGRVYAGAHLPLDVVGGVGLGLLAGTAARWGLGLDGAAARPLDEVPSLEVVEAEPARAGSGSQ